MGGTIIGVSVKVGATGRHDNTMRALGLYKIKGHHMRMGTLWGQGHLTGSPGIPVAPGSPCGKHRGRREVALECDCLCDCLHAGLSAANAATG